MLMSKSVGLTYEKYTKRIHLLVLPGLLTLFFVSHRRSFWDGEILQLVKERSFGP